MNKAAYLLLPLGIRTSTFGHGLVRLPKLEKFSEWMVGDFEKSFLPDVLVVPFSNALPIAEFLVGLFVMLGLFTSQSLTAGGVIMLALIFGTTTIENWDSLTSQLIHLAFFAMLLHFTNFNSLAIDQLR